MKRTIFFDKDGTLIKNIPYNVDPLKVEFLQGAQEALKELKDRYCFQIITNQPGVALGYFEEKELAGVHKKLKEMFRAMGAELEGFHYCPHSKELECACRKPGAKLLEDAAVKFGIDLSSSWMIGDILDDIEAGRRAGCKTILIDNGNETEWVLNPEREPHFKVQSLLEIIPIINQEEK